MIKMWEPIETIVRKIANFFKQPSVSEEQKRGKTPMQSKIEYKGLYFIGQEFLTFHSKWTGRNFTDWLKVEDKKLYKQHKKELLDANDFTLPILVSKIQSREIFAQWTEEVTKLVKKWNRENTFFFFLSDKNKYCVPFAGAELLSFLYDIGKDEFIELKDGNPFAAIDIEHCIKIYSIGLDFNDAEITILKDIVKTHNKKLSNWKFFSLTESSTLKAKRFVTDCCLSNVQYCTFKTFKAIPPTANEKERLRRYERFKAFGAQAENIFTGLCEEKERTCRYRELYTLNICYGSRNGMDDSSIVEIFWGQRGIDNLSLHNLKLCIERGTTLLFQRQSSGFVNVFIIPGGTDDIYESYTGIAICRQIDPNRLLDNGFQNKLWSILVAFTECTSLDGMPSCMQRFKKFQYRNFNRQLIGNEIINSRFRSLCGSVLQWVLTIGLSGALLTCVQTCKEWLCSDSGNLYQISTRVSSIDSLCKEGTKDLNEISSELDSINKMLKMRTSKKSLKAQQKKQMQQ